MKPPFWPKHRKNEASETPESHAKTAALLPAPGRSGIFAPLALLLIAALLAAVSGIVVAQSPSDYSASVEITVSNNSTTTDLFGPIPASINADNLELGGFVDFTTEDTLFTDSANVKVGGIAQDTGDNGVNWWWFADAGRGQTGIVKLFMNGPTTTHMMPLGQNARVEVPDHASLDITDNLTLEATVKPAALVTGSSSTAIADKQGAYGLAMRASGQIFGYVQHASTTVTLRPNGAGDYTNIPFDFNCGAGHYLCVDESSPDEDSTYLWSNDANWQKDAFTLDDAVLPSPLVINSVTVHWRARGDVGVADTQPYLRLNGSETSGSVQSVGTSYADYSQTLARPGGGSWSAQDINDLQAVIGVRPNGGKPRVTQVYVAVDYAPRSEISYTGLTANVERALKLTYVSSDSLGLYLDSVLVATTTPNGTIAASTNPLTVGGDTDSDNAWFAGGITGVNVGDTSTTTPAWKLLLDFQPVDISETQAGTSTNSWLFTGTVADGSASANNATYYITRDLSLLDIEVGGLVLGVGAPPAPVVQPPPDVIGDTPIDIFLTPQPTVSASGSSLFIDPLVLAAEGSGMPKQAWFILLATFIAAPASARAFRVFPSWTGAAVIGGMVYAIVIFTFGLTTWFLAFYGIWAASTIAIHQYMKA